MNLTALVAEREARQLIMQDEIIVCVCMYVCMYVAMHGNVQNFLQNLCCTFDQDTELKWRKLEQTANTSSLSYGRNR